MYKSSWRGRSAPVLYIALSTCLLITTVSPVATAAESSPTPTAPELRFDTTSIGPRRFIAAHGRQSLISGYADGGQEMWAYPIQILDDYTVGFRAIGSTSEIDGVTLLSRITYEPYDIVRTYVGADFVVRERLFALPASPTVLVTYTVQSRHPVDILVHFHPVLDLMWPASLGGQSIEWNATASAYLISEPTHHFAAFIGSPDITAHDEIVNAAESSQPDHRPGFTLRASPGQTVNVVAGLVDPKAPLAASMLTKLTASLPDLLRQSRDHYRTWADESLQIETPNAAVNESLAWSEIALDQAWVCNSYLGCGLVAGYGPSRGVRRPQYDWFFAGDALVAIQSLVDTGQYERAKQALLFIIKYQDAGSGMIWHELSQSAAQVDWAHQYPYMFVHVDITFQYLEGLAHYIETSGDEQFAAEHWNSIQAAYRFCHSLVNTPDGLPRIPASKEGSNEQDRMSEESDLSAAWVAASTAYSTLAKLTGHLQAAEEAHAAADLARKSAAGRYWDEPRAFWIDGFTDDGRAVFSKSLHGSALVADHILSASQRNSSLDQLATSEFQTDWGTRSTPSSASTYNPNSYAKGSVWAIGTAGMATTFWREHRPSSAFPMWHTLIPWTSLDSGGHINEVLAGDFYHPQIESVPEQTWSSAGILTAAVHGLLGLDIEQTSQRFTFAPHLPAEWDWIRVANIKLSHGSVTLLLRRIADGLELEATNNGTPFSLMYQPEIALGSRLTGATLNDRPHPVKLLTHDQDQHADLTFTVPTGTTHCVLHFKGGVEIVPSSFSVLVGEPSHGEKVISTRYDGSGLTITADVDTSRENTLTLMTEWSISSMEGATVRARSENSYQLLLKSAPEHEADLPHYERVVVVVTFNGQSK